jgi:hypothetical protein
MKGRGRGVGDLGGPAERRRVEFGFPLDTLFSSLLPSDFFFIKSIVTGAYPRIYKHRTVTSTQQRSV